MSEKRNWKHFAAELLLIVVGINLGLFVNNLNEQRKETKLERQLLSELKTCLEGDLKDVNLNISIHEEGGYSGKQVLAQFETKEPIDSLVSHFVTTTNNWSYLISNNSTYESLKSIGFGVIKNDAIRQNTTELYNVDYRSVNEFERMHKEVRMKWEEILSANIETDWWQSDDLSFFEKIKKVPNSKFFIAKLKGTNLSLKNIYINDVKPRILKLIALIDKELEE